MKQPGHDAGNLRMVMDNVLILPDWLRDRRKERTTPGGIVLPASEKPDAMDAVLATVIAAGPGWYDEKIVHNEGRPDYKPPKPSRKFVPCEVRAGDRVLVDHSISGDPYIIDNIEYRIVRAENIIGIVEEEVAAE